LFIRHRERAREDASEQKLVELPRVVTTAFGTGLFGK